MIPSVRLCHPAVRGVRNCRHRLPLLVLMCASLGSLHAEDRQSASAGEMAVRADADAVRISVKGEPALHYVLKKPADSACSSPSACYFHPLTTPSGLVITDVAPEDHRHHRGAFLAWLEVRAGTSAGDFWGWGEHAPLQDRVIVHRGTENVAATPDGASFRVRNEWLAASVPLLKETLQVKVTFRKDARVHDFTWHLTPSQDLTLGRHAFSGFSVRTRKDAAIEAHDPDGAVKLPAPSHLNPETDWPSRPWYALELALTEGRKAGVAVMNHPDNPPSLWHNVTDIGLLNPCIIAPAAVHVKAGQSLTLRYRVVTFDGAVPAALLNELAGAFANPSPGRKK
jgi:hypothetical protein